jgi:monoamine oxidase
VEAVTENRVENELRALADVDRGRPRQHVTILGAGMAGLVAAHELEQLGHTVQVFEASGETKGRVRTHRFADGTYAELGAMRVPAFHDYTHHYIAKCGLELRRFVTSHENLSGFYDIRGERGRMRDACHGPIYENFTLSSQQRDDPIPPKMLARAVADVVEGLTDEERASLHTGDLASDRLRAIDRMTVGEFLRSRAGDDAAELVGAATGLEMMYDRTATILLRDAIADVGGRLDEIVGGLDLLPTGIAKLVKGDIAVHAPVRGIHPRSDGTVDVVVERDGTRTVESASRVLCTIPFPVLHTMDIEPAFSRRKTFAIRSMGYESSCKVLLHCRRRFWESDYGIAGGASQSDLLYRQLYYPSDNAIAVTEARPSERRFNTLYGGYQDGEYAVADPAASEGPGVLLASYTWGQDARRLGQMSFDERRDTVIRQVARIHPEVAEPGMVDDSASILWDQFPWALGSFAEFLPGQQSTMYNDAIAPEGNVHFAGEHVSLDNGWIQGAVMSALRAVREIVTAA